MTDLLTQSPAVRAISVSELNRRAKLLLEDGIAKIWVEGEISNLSRPASGHVYFSLKDDTAQIRCAWFKGRQRGPTINMKNGDQILAFGQVSLYEARGGYQLIVEQLETAGEGELLRQFEALKKKLASEGLFDESQKSTLPDLPTSVGVVTSPSGAAVRDIVTVLGRRFPSVHVIIYPTAVQGDLAARQIAYAIESAIKRDECDVLIVGRGGGSLEDLWPFNEEIVARAIAVSPIPVVSAVGHETDVTIADFVADVRAPTPSGAAELVVPDHADWLRHLETISTRVALLGRRYLEDRFQSLDWMGKRLSQASPATTVRRQRDWLRNLQQVMTGAIRHQVSNRRIDIADSQSRLMRQSPQVVVQRRLNQSSVRVQRLGAAGRKTIEQLTARLNVAARALKTVSPLATLDRGYAIVTDTESGAIVSDASRISEGQQIAAQLATGQLEATVTKSSINTEDD